MASTDFEVAVIGMSCRLPSCENTTEFWDFLLKKGDSVGDFPRERAKDVDHVTSTLDSSFFHDPCSKYFTGSFFESIDKFDESFFGVLPGEAQFIDPQQRFFLRGVYEAVEDAGLASTFYGSDTGIYVGNTMDRFRLLLTENSPSISHGNHPPFVASRVSYIYNLKGPAMMVSTGCSSSLLAVHLACQGLRSEDCGMAIAGGITLDLLPLSADTDIWNQLGITGPGMKCRAFDATSNGIAKGEGCGVVLLKPLKDALRDGNHIYGVIGGSVANQDGHSNGITAPNPLAQSNLLKEAWRRSNIDPNQITYFEAHGTGTQLGDPIEMMGIQLAFQEFQATKKTKEEKPRIGSVKGNIGHLADGAAGVVSLIKSLLCLHYGQIPGQTNFESPNTNINWDNSPFVVDKNTCKLFPLDEKERHVIGINSFGLVGTNVHVVLKEWKTDQSTIQNGSREEPLPPMELEPILISAKTQVSLLGFLKKLEGYGLNRIHNKTNDSAFDLNNIGYTLNKGREHNKNKSFKTLLFPKDFDDLTKQTRRAINCVQEVELPEISDLMTLDEFQESGHRRKTLCFNITKKNNTMNEKSKDAYEYGSTSASAILSAIYHGQPIPWTQFYHGRGRTHVPQLPTYFFDEKRFWPRPGSPIFFSMSQSQSQSQNTDTKKQIEVIQPPSVTQSTKLINSDGIRKSLSTILTSATNGVIVDWDSVQNVSLFDLGLDSLIMSQIQNKLTQEFGEAGDLSPGEVQQGHTFEGLTKLLTRKILHSSLNHVNVKETKAKETTSTSSVTSYPVSTSQRRLWLIHGLTPNKSAYNTSNGLRINGPLNLRVFKEVFEATVNRHDAFFTNFTFNDEAGSGALVGRIDRTKQIELIQVCPNTESQTLNEIDRVVMDAYTQDYTTPFDLENDPLIRAKIYKLSQDSFLLTVIVHHIAFDGRSHFIFYNQLWKAYRDALSGGDFLTSTFTQTNIGETFKGFALQEQKFLQTRKATKQFNYWRQKFENFDFSRLSTIPGDKPRPSVFTAQGKRHTIMIDSELIEGIRKLDSGRFTMFQKLVGAVYMVMNMYSGDTDLILGSPVAGRPRGQGFEETIGFFVNILPLRIQLNPEDTLAHFLTSISTTVVEALSNATVSFDSVLSQLGALVPRDTSLTPLFSVSACYHNTERKDEHVAPPDDLRVQRVLPHNASAKWDLYFDFLEEQDGGMKGQMRFTLEYYSDIYSDHFAYRIAQSFLGVLRQMSLVQSSDIQIHNLMCGEDAVIHGPIIHCTEISLAKSFLDKCKELKASTAVSIYGSPAKKTSYEDLGHSATRLAYFLRVKCSLEPGDRVGLLLTSNTENSVVSVWACLISSLVFVPLDTDSPNQRLQWIIRNANCKALLYTKSYLKSANILRWMTSSPIESMICVDHLSHDASTLIEPIQDTLLMDNELWDGVSERGGDNAISSGGWTNSYDGNQMSIMEMEEYSLNVLHKLKPYISQTSKVLEIGCGSGFTTRVISPLVNDYDYYATDLSKSMIQRLKSRMQKSGQNKVVHFVHAPAHEVRKVLKNEGPFDVIIINSVIHCFPGHNYLTKIIQDVGNMLTPDGVLFIGDVMDEEKRLDLIESTKSYKSKHPAHKTKIDWSNELFVSQQYLRATFKSIPQLSNGQINFSHKIHTLSNELTKFRFDVILKLGNIKEGDNWNSSVPIPGNYTQSDVSSHLSDVVTLDELIYHLVELPHQSNESTPVYILYTSGTTGSPRGVIIGHGGLVNYLHYASHEYGMNEKAVMGLFSKLTFDFTLTSLLCPILSGGRIVIFDPFETSYMDIAITGSSNEINTIKLSPLQLQLMMDYCSELSLTLPMTTFILGGEELTSHLLTQLKRLQGDKYFVVFNEYGPTEATVGCIVQRIESDQLPLFTEGKMGRVRIGTPIQNTSAFILNSTRTKILPPGAHGIICLMGPQLCQGFTTGDEVESRSLTTLRVLHKNHSIPLNTPIFITDDIGCVSLDDPPLFEFHGRISQGIIKINEIRIDTHEIQRVIESVPLVRQAWVLPIQFNGKTLLGAIVRVVDVNEGRLEQNTLSTILNQSLPKHGIPTVYNIITGTPTMNRNGKLDSTPLLNILQANSVDGRSRGNETDEIIPTDTEKIIQIVFKDILKLHGLPSVHSNFFELGGDSMGAICGVRRLQSSGLPIRLQMFYEFKTIRDIGNALERLSSSSAVAQAQRQKESLKLFTPTPIVQDFLCRKLFNPNWFSLPALGKFLSSSSVPTIHQFNAALRLILTKHEGLRSTFNYNSDKNEWTQQIMDMSDIQITTKEFNVGMKSPNGTEHKIYHEDDFGNICEELESVIDIQSGPAFQSALLTYGLETYFLLVAHHIVVDIISWEAILEDLAFSLSNITAMRTPNIGTVMSPISTFCDTIKKSAFGLFHHQIPYWKKIECEMEMTRDEDGTRKGTGTFGTFSTAQFISTSVPYETFQEISSRNGVKIETIILSSLGHGLTNLKDLSGVQLAPVICMEGHGRELPDAEIDTTQTVGWLTSRYPLSLMLPPSSDSNSDRDRDSIMSEAQMLEEKMKGIPDRGLGYGILRSAGLLTLLSSSLPKIMFVFLGRLDRHHTPSSETCEFMNIPWIEVMLHEMRLGRYHRPPQESLEFSLEVICWVVENEFKIGCLFSSEVYSESMIEEFLGHIKTHIHDMHNAKDKNKDEKLPEAMLSGNESLKNNLRMKNLDGEENPNRNNHLNCTIFSSFEIPPETLKSIESVCTSTFASIGLSKQISIITHPPNQIIQSLYSASTRTEPHDKHLQIVIFLRHENEVFVNSLEKALKDNEDKFRGQLLLILEIRVELDDNSVPSTALSPFFESKCRQTIHRILRMTCDEFDSFGSAQYNIPFDLNGYEKITRAIMRGTLSKLNPSKTKVIAVDADNTLWKGECANGPVTITPPHLQFQKFLVQKYHEGYLLVLLSKNSEMDVINVFKSQSRDLVLTLDHFVSTRINWNSKSDNLCSVAMELNLSVDSFVFFDDSALECTAMLQTLPNVLCILVPQQMGLMEEFLDRIWVFDSFYQQQYDSDAHNRTMYYKQEQKRKLVTESSSSLVDVLRSWNMELRLAVVNLNECEVQISTRVEELIHRTNQFNANPIFKLNPTHSTNFECLIGELEDDFGNFGLITALIFVIEKKKNGNRMRIVEWVMSCRALGRGVEHNVLKYLKDYSIQNELTQIQFVVSKTHKNEPVFKFLNECRFSLTNSQDGEQLASVDLSGLHIDDQYLSLMKIVRKEGMHSWNDQKDPATTTEELNHNLSSLSHCEGNTKQSKHDLDLALQDWTSEWPKELRNQINAIYLDPLIFKNEENGRIRTKDKIVLALDADIGIDHVLKEGWIELLGEEPEPNSIFFESGGTSFKAVFLISKIRLLTGIDLQLKHFYECPIYNDLFKLLKTLPSIENYSPNTTRLLEITGEGLSLSSIQKELAIQQDLNPSSTSYTESIGIVTDILINPEAILFKLLSSFTYLQTVYTENGEGEKIVGHWESSSTNHTRNANVNYLILPTLQAQNIEEGLDMIRASTPSFRIQNNEPLIRMRVVKLLNSSQSILVLHVHHILIDDISLQAIEEGLFDLIDGIPESVNTNNHYAIYVRQELEYLTSNAKSIDLSKVEALLNGAPEIPPKIGFHTEEWMNHLTYVAQTKTTQIQLDLKGICVTWNCRPFHVFLSCYLLTLSRYTGHSDLLVAIPVTTRTFEFQSSIGPFLNTLLFRQIINFECDLIEFIQEVRDAWNSTQETSRLPINELNSSLTLTLLNNMFNYSNNSKSNPNSLFIPPLHAKSQFSMDVLDDGNGNFKIVQSWAKQIIDSDVANNFFASFINSCREVTSVLSNNSNGSAIPLHQIDVMSQAELDHLNSFNKILDIDPGSPNSAFGYFGKNSASYPDRVAIFTGRSPRPQITYNQLNSMVTLIAENLLRRLRLMKLEGFLTQQPILLLMDKDENAVATILAIWKLGGFFLPLSEDTQRRVDTKDKEFQFSVLITNLSPDKIVIDLSSTLECIEMSSLLMRNETESAPVGLALHSSPTYSNPFAYAMTTSGSTGKPKLCFITQEALSILIESWKIEYELEDFGHTHGTVNVLQWASFAFDVFMGDLAKGILSVPGSLTLIPNHARMDVQEIKRLIQENEPTFGEFTPSFLLHLIEAYEEDSGVDVLKCFKIIVAGSDILHQKTFHQIKRRLGQGQGQKQGQRLFNSYGMTEATIDSALYEGECKYKTGTGLVPIGKPMRGVQLTILDPRTKLRSPIGVVGELTISGKTVGDYQWRNYTF